MSDIEDIRYFVHIIEAEGLSAASRSLHASIPVVSRRLKALEERLGVRLITRTTRHFEPTEEGRIFYERCVCILRDLDDAEAEISTKTQSPRGLLRVGAPMGLGRRLIGPIIGQFMDAYPDIQVSLRLSDGGWDVIDDSLDVALRVGLPADTDIVARKVLSERRIVCAAPDYIARHGEPRHPDDLGRYNCLHLIRRSDVLDNWRFRENNSAFMVRTRGTLSSNNSEVLREWAIAGQGIALLALWDIRDDVASGRLQECLGDFWCDSIDLFLLYASRKHLSPRIRVFSDFIASRLSRVDALDS